MSGAAVPCVGVLVCDHVASELRGAAGGADYGRMYAAFLERGHLPDGWIVREYDAVDGELPPGPDACDAWIITGARYDAFGNDPWTTELRSFVAVLYEQRARTVGICFGHQVLAQALGGRVERATGWKAGPQHLDVAPTPWFPGGSVWLNAMHRDVVTELPPGAERIGVGSTGALPVFVLDDVILGIQDHPEFDATYTAALTEARRHLMGDALADEALHTLATTATDGDRVARWVVDFLLDHRR